jgi:transposase
MWFVGLDVHPQTTTISVRSARGAIVARHVVETNAVALRRVLAKFRGKTRIVCEASSLAFWVKRTLQTMLREVIVCDRRRTRLAIRGGSKSDKIDADALSECLRIDKIHPVFVPGLEQEELRRLARHYDRLVRDRTRYILRLKSLFLESGVRIRLSRKRPEHVPLRHLREASAKAVARSYARQIALLRTLIQEARGLFLSAASAHSAYALLQTIPCIGEIRSAHLLAIIADPWRFGSRRRLWAYGGLAVIQRTSSEHSIEQGKVVRNQRVRGVSLARVGLPSLKKVLKDIALHASYTQSPLRNLYNQYIARGQRPSIARITLARKIAAIIIAVWRTGKPFNPAKLRKRNKASGRASDGPVSHRRASAGKAT